PGVAVVQRSDVERFTDDHLRISLTVNRSYPQWQARRLAVSSGITSSMPTGVRAALDPLFEVLSSG
ncbi:hypothetical protein, partial [Pseudomonas viridiflava]|uniref:hypothetical protein n=1 Tax=Pseudomonas viridiflava TaxID=33069 RepID=UPI0019D0B4AB